MKNNYLSISIEEPCHENWSEMTPVEKGRHCQSCQKDVIDFTKMHKAGIAEYMLKNEGSICGRFTKDQLDTNLLPPRKNRLFLKWAALLLGFIPFSGLSQYNSNPKKSEQVTMGKRMMSNHYKNKPIPKVSKEILTGNVVGTNDESIAFAHVAAYDQSGKLMYGVSSDINGNFQIQAIPKGRLEVSFIGYKTSSTPFSALIKTMKNAKITLIENSYLLGDVEIVAYKATSKCTYMGAVSSYTSKSNKSENIKESQVKNEKKETTKIINKIYPNPTLGFARIEFHHKLEGGELIVTNLQNQIILKEKIERRNIDFDLSTQLPGTYILSILLENKLVASEIIVKI